MRQPEGVVRAAQRWLRLLARSPIAQASAILRTDPRYSDLSESHYSLALEWLEDLGLVVAVPSGRELSDAARSAEGQLSDLLLFERAVQGYAPTWLPDADILVLDVQELPQDASRLADLLSLSEDQAFACIREIHGHIDLAQRAAVGAAGERALLAWLEAQHPGSTRHVAALHDGFGYDIAFSHGAGEWHLEVKSTKRRGRLSIHLSRHELEVARHDKCWAMIVLRLTGDNQIDQLWTVPKDHLFARAPLDASPITRWESARYELDSGELHAGLLLGGAKVMSPISPG